MPFISKNALEALINQRALEMVDTWSRKAIPTTFTTREPCRIEHVVRFADVEEVQGYMVREHVPGALVGSLPRSPIFVTDDEQKALACLREDPRMRQLKACKLWRGPGGILMWKNEIQVAKLGEMWDGERYRK
jgi:hypothetical protein